MGSRPKAPARAAALFIVLAAAFSLVAAVVPRTPARAQTSGAPNPPSTYWLFDQAGGVYSFGAAPFAGSAASQRLNQPIVGMAGVPDRAGYWLVAADGGIFSFGTAHFWGSTGAMRLNKPIVGMAPTPDGNGYWLVATDGGIFTFGDAGFFGSTGNLRLNKPIVGMAPTPDGQGYYLVASDGGMFTFGDATFHGSTGAIHLNQPIVGMALTPDGAGYWLVATDGGIFNFGDATFHGSLGATHLNQPIVGMAAPEVGAAGASGAGGYWLVAADGGVFSFGNAVYHGSLAGKPPAAPVVGIVTTQSLDPYTPQSTGYDISWPQCSKSNPAQVASEPSSPAAISVVGVGGGLAFNDNPCLAAEASWARQGGGVTVYMNINSPTSSTAAQGMNGPDGMCAPSDQLCQGYNFGYNAATHAYSYAQSVSVSAPMWWLDVEGPAGSGNPLWSSATGVNDQVIAGAIAALTALGVEPGIYSTITQWDEIAGSGYTPDVPAWRAGAGDISGAQSLCPASFTSGPTWLVQYGTPSPWDQDYAC
ncbi:MAG TPA: hypothetical protein VFW24_15045 [Acidimicrobiales bacterium]|nr:hypothetical protein [Acidimicrobiales bacterium]